jgi:glycerol-3-phosphate acyltransferase PlsY
VALEDKIEQATTTIALIAGVSYLLGSIPFGYLLVSIFRGEDVRKSGSGNIGATNVSRKSPALGVLTLVLDALKGTAAVVLSYIIADHLVDLAPSYEHLALAGTFAVLGHIFPLWLKFRGGKGVATALGSFALIAPEAVGVSAVLFIVVVLIFRYVSLGSISAVALFPLLVWLFHQFGLSPKGLILISFTSLLIIARHHENIRRLLTGTENRIGAKHAGAKNG